MSHYILLSLKCICSGGGGAAQVPLANKSWRRCGLFGAMVSTLCSLKSLAWPCGLQTIPHGVHLCPLRSRPREGGLPAISIPVTAPLPAGGLCPQGILVCKVQMMKFPTGLLSEHSPTALQDLERGSSWKPSSHSHL